MEPVSGCTLQVSGCTLQVAFTSDRQPDFSHQTGSLISHIRPAA
nr:MAG TPA: hypothetical protein [Caudoviricetes sp.]